MSSQQIDQLILQQLQQKQLPEGEIQAISPEEFQKLEFQKLQNNIQNDNIDIRNQLKNKQKIFVTVPESGYINQFDVFNSVNIPDLNNKFQACINSCSPPHLPVLTPIQYYTGLIECQYTLLKYAYTTVTQLLTLTYKYDFNFAKVADEMKIYSAIQCLEIFVTYIIALERNEHCLTQQEIETYQAFKPFYQQLLWCELDKDVQQNQLAYFETELVSQSIIQQTDMCFGLLRLAQARINYIAEKLNAQVICPPAEILYNGDLQHPLTAYELELLKTQQQQPTFILPQQVSEKQLKQATQDAIKNISYKTVISTVPTSSAVTQLTRLYESNTNQKDIDMKLFSSKGTAFYIQKYIKSGDLLNNIAKNSLQMFSNVEYPNNYEFELKQGCSLPDSSCFTSNLRYTVQDEFVCYYAIISTEVVNQTFKQIKESERPEALKYLFRMKQELTDFREDVQQVNLYFPCQFVCAYNNIPAYDKVVGVLQQGKVVLQQGRVGKKLTPNLSKQQQIVYRSRLYSNSVQPIEFKQHIFRSPYTFLFQVIQICDNQIQEPQNYKIKIPGAQDIYQNQYVSYVSGIYSSVQINSIDQKIFFDVIIPEYIQNSKLYIILQNSQYLGKVIQLELKQYQIPFIYQEQLEDLQYNQTKKLNINNELIIEFEYGKFIFHNQINQIMIRLPQYQIEEKQIQYKMPKVNDTYEINIKNTDFKILIDEYEQNEQGYLDLDQIKIQILTNNDKLICQQNFIPSEIIQLQLDIHDYECQQVIFKIQWKDINFQQLIDVYDLL